MANEPQRQQAEVTQPARLFSHTRAPVQYTFQNIQKDQNGDRDAESGRVDWKKRDLEYWEYIYEALDLCFYDCMSWEKCKVTWLCVHVYACLWSFYLKQIQFPEVYI